MLLSQRTRPVNIPEPRQPAKAPMTDAEYAEAMRADAKECNRVAGHRAADQRSHGRAMAKKRGEAGPTIIARVRAAIIARGRWMDMQEVADAAGVSRDEAATALRRLLKGGEIDKRSVSRGQGQRGGTKGQWRKRESQ